MFLEALGINLGANPERVKQALEAVGIKPSSLPEDGQSGDESGRPPAQHPQNAYGF